MGKKRSSLSLFLSLFFDGFALPSSYHHHPTAFKHYDLMTVLHLIPSSIHYAEESEKKREERRRRHSAVTQKCFLKTNKQTPRRDKRFEEEKKHNSRRDEKQKRTMNHRQKSRNPRCNPFVDPHIRACLLTRPVSPRLT